MDIQGIGDAGPATAEAAGAGGDAGGNDFSTGFELDLSPEFADDGDQGGEQAAPQSRGPAPAPAAQPELGASQVEEIRALHRETVGALAEIRAARSQPSGQQRGFDPNTPPVDPNNITSVQELLALQDWREQRMMQHLTAVAEQRATGAASSARARGLLSAATMGEGFDFDSMVNRLAVPVFRDNPAARQAVHAANPEDPAAAEYAFALIQHMIRANNGDLVKTFANVLAGINAPAQAETTLRRRIARGEQRAAQRIAQGSTGVRPTGTRATKVDARWIEDASDAEFKAFDEAVMSGRVKMPRMMQ